MTLPVTHGAENGSLQPPISNKLADAGNTSSIMLCNAPSIMQREAPGVTGG